MMLKKIIIISFLLFVQQITFSVDAADNTYECASKCCTTTLGCYGEIINGICKSCGKFQKDKCIKVPLNDNDSKRAKESLGERAINYAKSWIGKREVYSNTDESLLKKYSTPVIIILALIGFLKLKFG